MWIVKLIYRVPLEMIDRFRAEHVQFLLRLHAQGKLLGSGALVPRTGGVAFVPSMAKEDVMKLFESDPFHREGLADYEWIEVALTKEVPQVFG